MIRLKHLALRLFAGLALAVGVPIIAGGLAASLAQTPMPPQLTQERLLAQYGLAVARLDLCGEHVAALTSRIEALQKELDELKNSKESKK